MFEDLILGIIYRAAHEVEVKTAKEFNGWFVCGFGYMFQRGAAPPRDHIHWDAVAYCQQYAEEGYTNFT